MRRLILFLAILSTHLVNGQTIKGKLFGKLPDGDRDILPDGTISWIGTNTAVSVNTNGVFEISATNVLDKRLVASYTGYLTDTIKWTGNSYLSIVLEPKNTFLGELTVTGNRGAFISSLSVAKTEVINKLELSKAACCDLAGCFGTQASVQAHPTNAVTNSQELRLLGLSGVYNQVLFEGMPMIQGLSYTYGISTYPGSIVENIHISKGTTSVLQGYESISGQINVESRKSASTEKLYLNAYTNSFLEKHLNTNMTFDVGKNKNWHSLLAIHTAQPAKRIDRNYDNFMDLPLLTRYMAYNKWEYNTGKPTGLTTQLGWRLVNEGRIGGQLNYEEKANQGSSTIYGQSVKFTQPEFFVKSGYRFSDKHALTSSFSGFYHDQHSWFGNALFKANQLSFYLHIQHEWAWSNNNLFKYGTSYRYQKLKENISFANSTETRTYSGIYHTNLNVPGFFIENTFSGLDDKLTLITGLRVDKHQQWSWYTTPRMMGKFTFNPHHTLRASVGKGWRQVNLFSEQVTLLASSRDIIFTEKLKPETATTWGLSHTWNFRLGGGNFTLSGDFYQTAFRNQFFPDYDSDPTKAFIANFEGKTRSNSLQIDALASFLAVWEIRMAYNYLNVYRLEDGIENSLLFNPRNRVMTTISFRPNDKWQFDMNGHWHDHMRLPDTRRNPVPYQRPLYSKPYALLSLQGTYKLDKADIYVGSENINGFRQDRPIISTDNPFGQYFDLSSVWGPIRGREFYVGIRFKISPEN